MVRGRDEVSIGFENGEILSARHGGAIGESVFYEVANWEEGSFQFDESDATEERMIQTPTSALLMEAARRCDEMARLCSYLPNFDSSLIIDDTNALPNPYERTHCEIFRPSRARQREINSSASI